MPETLIKYLEGWTSVPFTPIHLPKAGEIWASNVVKELEPIPGLDLEIVKHYMFPLFDSATLRKTALVSKTWAALSYEEKPAQAKREQLAEKEEISRRRELIKDIYNAFQGMSPAPEGEGKPSNRLQYEDFTISEPTWYGCNAIICKLTTPIYSKFIRVRKGASDVDIFNYEDGSFDNNDLKRLHELCTQGKTGFQYGEEDAEINTLLFK